MGQSSNELCGHDREALRESLTRANEEYATEEFLRDLASAADEPIRSCFAAIIDPAKLAKMLTTRGRELGLCRMFVGIAAENVVHAHVGTTEIHRLLMFQARAILAAWLELGDGEAEKAKEALRGEQ